MAVEDKKTDTTAAKNTNRKRKRDIIFAEVFGEDHDFPEQELDDDMASSGCVDEFSFLSDSELKTAIVRLEKSLTALAAKLPDGGARFRAKLLALREELKRRQHRRSQKVAVRDDNMSSSSGCGGKFLSMSNGELKTAIDRLKKSLSDDVGACLRAKLQNFEEELKRNQHRCSRKLASNRYKKPMQSESSTDSSTEKPEALKKNAKDKLVSLEIQISELVMENAQQKKELDATKNSLNLTARKVRILEQQTQYLTRMIVKTCN